MVIVSSRKVGDRYNDRVCSSGSDTSLTGFDWKSLPKGSIVVDVGGNNGSQTAALAKEFDHLQYVVQDRAPVIENDAPKVGSCELEL